MATRFRRSLDALTKPELLAAAQRMVASRKFRCERCYNEVFTAIADGRWTRFNAAPHRSGSFVLVPRGGLFHAVELTVTLPAEEWGKTVGLDQYVLHSRMCGPPTVQWWLHEKRYLGHRPLALGEEAVWVPPSGLQVGDRVIQAIAPQEGELPVPAPSYVTAVGEGYAEFNGRRRAWDDRARIQVKRPFEGTAYEIFFHMLALQALAQAGCRCQMPIPELRLGERPTCRRCRTDAGWVKGLHRRHGWAPTPAHISVAMPTTMLKKR